MLYRLRPSSGFSLIEVLVALLVVSFGLLGIAGMQAMSVGNTGVANQRSLAALQASSISAAMSSNEGFWQTPSAPPSVKVINSTITSSGLSASSVDCSANLCNAAQMASYDVSQWGQTLAAVLPNGWGTINCAQPSNAPVTCQIYIYWSEKTYVQNQLSTASSTDSSQYDFEMVVQP